MRLTASPLQYDIETSDFGAGASLSLPCNVDYSFTLGGALVVPDETIAGVSETTFTFHSTLPDRLTIHKPLQGVAGKMLPVRNVIEAQAMLHTDITLSVDDVVPRRQPQTQTTDIAMLEDASFTRILVAKNTAYLRDSTAPRTDMKMTENNRGRHCLTAFYIADEHEEHDSLSWNEPLYAMMEVYSLDDGEVSRRHVFGGLLVQGSWSDDDARTYMVPDGQGGWTWSSAHVAGLGYQFASCDGLKVYRDKDGKWGDSLTYCLHAETWGLRDEFNAEKDRRWLVRARYANGVDEHGRTIWRGWSPMVGFTTNTAPEPPVKLRLDG